jgi:hypothetical protein
MDRSCTLSTMLILALVFPFVVPDTSWGGMFDFDDIDDTLKTTGIIIGITAGVVLVVVLIAGTIKDIKGGDEEEIDIWADIRQDGSMGYLSGLLAGPLPPPPAKVAASTPFPEGPGCSKGIRLVPEQRDHGTGLNPELFRFGGEATACSEAGISIGNSPETPTASFTRFAGYHRDRPDDAPHAR